MLIGYQVLSWKIFSHLVECGFSQMMFPFAIQEFLSFMRSHLFIFYLSTCTDGNAFPVPMSSKLFPSFSSFRFSVFSFMLRSWIHLQLIFVQILLPEIGQFVQHHLLKMLSLPHSVFVVSLSKISCVYLCLD